METKNTKPLLDVLKEFKREVFFTEIQDGTRIHIRIFDFIHSKRIKREKGRYIVFDSLALEDIPSINVEKGDYLLFHVAEKSFLIALGKFKNRPVMKDEIYDVIFIMDRITKKKTQVITFNITPHITSIITPLIIP